MQVYGIEAIVRIVCHFSFIYLAFWSMQSLRTDTFFKKTNTTQIRMILTMFAIGVGYLVSSFFLECMELIRNFVFTLLK